MSFPSFRVRAAGSKYSKAPTQHADSLREKDKKLAAGQKAVDDAASFLGLSFYQADQSQSGLEQIDAQVRARWFSDGWAAMAAGRN